MPSVGQILDAGLAKESVVGTVIAAPTEFLPLLLPDSFYPSISLLESVGIRAVPDRIYKISQGAGEIKGMKAKWEAEAENIGNLLMGSFGTDTLTESPSFVINSSNNKIDFKQGGGSQLHATIASATYAMGSSSAVAGSLCAAVKTAMDAQGGGTTYTITWNSGTKKITITPSASTVQILWLTGTNQATAAYAILGFSHADTSDASAQTSDSTTSVAAQLHTFTRINSAQLPSYTWWFNKAASKFPQFAGCMVSKLDLACKAKEFLFADSEWTGLNYDDTGITHSPSYSAVRPFTFPMLTVNVDGGPILDYDNVKITIDNMVKADHALAQTIYPKKIYSEGIEVTITLDLFVEDNAQWNKFLAGTSCALNFVWTSADDISGGYTGTKYKLTVDIPTCYYSAAPRALTPGVLKISFAAKASYTVASTKTISAALINSVSTAY